MKAAVSGIHRLLLCKKMYENEDCAEVCDCRNGCCRCDMHIFDADHFRHDECACTHDRRHDLPACGCNRLDCRSLFRRIAGFLHQRDGQDAGGRNVRNRRTGDHAQQTGGNNRCLCRTAGRLVAELHAHVDQHAAAAAVGEERTEYHEVEQCIQTGGKRASEDTVLSEHQGLAELREGHAGKTEDTADVLSEKCVCHEKDQYCKKRQGNDTAYSLHDAPEQQDSHKDLQARHLIDVIDTQIECVCICKEVPADNADRDIERAVIDPPEIFQLIILVFNLLNHGIKEKNDPHGEAEMQRDLCPRLHRLAELDVKLEDCHGDCQDRDRPITPLRHGLQLFGDLAFLIGLLRHLRGLFIHGKLLLSLGFA